MGYMEQQYSSNVFVFLVHAVVDLSLYTGISSHL